jgi:hypothetical protein
MNCYLHPETAAVAFCRSCGKPLCAICQRPFEGTVYCQDHAPVASYANTGYANPAGSNAPGAANPYVQPLAASSVPPVQTSPALAFILGWIPGVGAIYNGQYIKGLVHVLIFASIISILNSDPNAPSDAFFGIMLAAFVIYMPFEAYHTAKKRQVGIQLDEWSSLLAQSRYAGRAPIGPVILIIIGILFLLDTLRVIEFREIGRFWPVILIVAGAYMLYNRVTGPGSNARTFAQPYSTAPRTDQGPADIDGERP